MVTVTSYGLVILGIVVCFLGSKATKCYKI